MLETQFPDNYFCVRQKCIAVLISIPDGIKKPALRLEQITHKLFQFLDDAYQPVLSAGISAVLTKRQIPDAYLQAETALEYYAFVPKTLVTLDNSFFSQPLSDALDQIHSAFSTACSEILSGKQGLASIRWGSDICHFIENNYFDANLNLNSIAEHFRVSSSYMSRKFKEQYQKSVIDYLYEVRIGNAIKLMDETSLKVGDLARMTGFGDSNAFIRIFKRYKGITPGKYIASR